MPNTISGLFLPARHQTSACVYVFLDGVAESQSLRGIRSLIEVRVGGLLGVYLNNSS